MGRYHMQELCLSNSKFLIFNSEVQDQEINSQIGNHTKQKTLKKYRNCNSQSRRNQKINTIRSNDHHSTTNCTLSHKAKLKNRVNQKMFPLAVDTNKGYDITSNNSSKMEMKKIGIANFNTNGKNVMIKTEVIDPQKKENYLPLPIKS